MTKEEKSRYSEPGALKDILKRVLSGITNALDQNERMSFIRKQVGHTTKRMIADH